MNLYAYVANSPLAFVDPSGLLMCSDRCSPIGFYRCRRLKLALLFFGGNAPGLTGVSELASVDLGCDDGSVKIDAKTLAKLISKTAKVLSGKGGPIAAPILIIGGEITAGVGVEFKLTMKYDCCSEKNVCVLASLYSLAIGKPTKCWYWDWEGKFKKSLAVPTSLKADELGSGGFGGILSAGRISQIKNEVQTAYMLLKPHVKQDCWNRAFKP